MRNSALLGFALLASTCCFTNAALACNEEQAETVIMAQYKKNWEYSKGEITEAIGAAFKYNLPTGTEYRFRAYIEGTLDLPTFPGSKNSVHGRAPFSQIIFGVVDENCNIVQLDGMGGLKSLH